MLVRYGRTSRVGTTVVKKSEGIWWKLLDALLTIEREKSWMLAQLRQKWFGRVTSSYTYDARHSLMARNS